MVSHLHDDPSSQIIEGISNDLLYLFFGVTLFISLVIVYVKMFRPSRDIHPHHLEQVQEIRQRVLENRGEEPTQRQQQHTRGEDDRCPICIDVLSFAVETNCGHIFCCKLILTIISSL